MCPLGDTKEVKTWFRFPRGLHVFMKWCGKWIHNSVQKKAQINYCEIKYNIEFVESSINRWGIINSQHIQWILLLVLKSDTQWWSNNYIIRPLLKWVLGECKFYGKWVCVSTRNQDYIIIIDICGGWMDERGAQHSSIQSSEEMYLFINRFHTQRYYHDCKGYQAEGGRKLGRLGCVSLIDWQVEWKHETSVKIIRTCVIMHW